MKDINITLLINIIIFIILIPLLLFFNLSMAKIMFIIIIYAFILIIYYIVNVNKLNNKYFLVKEPGLKDKVEYCPIGCVDGICNPGDNSVCTDNYECNYCINKTDNKFIINDESDDYDIKTRNINKQVIRLNNYINNLNQS